MTKNFLYVTYGAPPRGTPAALRAAKMIKYLPAYGWRPVVLTCDVGRSFESTRGFIESEMCQDADILRVRDPFDTAGQRLRNNFVGRRGLFGKISGMAFPDRQVLWAIGATMRALEWAATNNIRAVLSSSPPVSGHLAAMVIAKIIGVPWICEFRDPWTRWNPSLRRGLLGQFARFLERRMYKMADRIVLISNALREDVLCDAPKAESKISVIPNGYDPADYPASKAERLFPEDVFTVTYAGRFYQGARSPEGFLRALRRLKEEKRISSENFRFVVLSEKEPVVEDLVVKEGVQDLVEFLGFLPYSEALKILVASDCLLLITHMHHPSLPVKVFDYIGAKRPIIALTNPRYEVADIVRSVNPQALVCFPDEVDKIACWIRKAMEGAMEFSFVDLGVYHRQIGAKKLAELLDGVAG